MTNFGDDRYGPDIFSRTSTRAGSHNSPPPRKVRIENGTVLEDPASGFVGAAIAFERVGGNTMVHLEDRHGNRKLFPLGLGFWLEGEPIEALPPAPKKAATADSLRRGHGGRKLTNSGSRAVPNQRARVARASRIWVEGRHDAELVQHVWGDDLAHEGVVVELLEGVDHLEEVLATFAPNEQRRAGVLLDHLVAHSKETRLAQAALKQWPVGLRILGHPFVDVWQAIKPGLFGLRAWPQVPRHIDIKVGTLQALGWPHTDQADVAQGWQQILARVKTYRDLEPTLLGPVEELIDFVTAPGTE